MDIHGKKYLCAGSGFWKPIPCQDGVCPGITMISEFICNMPQALKITEGAADPVSSAHTRAEKHVEVVPNDANTFILTNVLWEGKARVALQETGCGMGLKQFGEAFQIGHDHATIGALKGSSHSNLHNMGLKQILATLAQRRALVYSRTRCDMSHIVLGDPTNLTEVTKMDNHAVAAYCWLLL